MFPNRQYSQWEAWICLLSKFNAIMLLLLFLILFFWKNGWSWERKRKIIKILLKIHDYISQSHEGSCAFFILRKYLCKHLQESIFLCSLVSEEGRHPPLEEKKDWRIKSCSLCSQRKYCQLLQGWAGRRAGFSLYSIWTTVSFSPII